MQGQPSRCGVGDWLGLGLGVVLVLVLVLGVGVGLGWGLLYAAVNIKNNLIQTHSKKFHPYSLN